MTPLDRAILKNMSKQALQTTLRWLLISAMFFGATFALVAFPVLCGML